MFFILIVFYVFIRVWCVQRPFFNILNKKNKINGTNYSEPDLHFDNKYQFIHARGQTNILMIQTYLNNKKLINQNGQKV